MVRSQFFEPQRLEEDFEEEFFFFLQQIIIEACEIAEYTENKTSYSSNSKIINSFVIIIDNIHYMNSLDWKFYLSLA